MIIKQHLPNAITLLNLFCGCGAIVCIIQGDYLPAVWFSAFGLAADFLDGAVARALRVSSELGRQLDSLADVVSFGVAPGMVFYQLLSRALPETESFLNIIALPGFLLSVFAAVRLARFNLDTRQPSVFRGLPTPACAIYTLGLLLIVHFDSFGGRSFILQPAFLYANLIVLCGLMVSGLPMFSFKFTRFSWSGNEIKFIFAAVALALMVLLREAAFSAIILLYILVSSVLYFKKIELR